MEIKNVADPLRWTEGAEPPMQSSEEARSSPLTAAEITAYFERRGIEHTLVRHPRCGTSEESFVARQQATGRSVTGAKAIVVRAKAGNDGSSLVLAVLRGFDRLSSGAFKDVLKSLLGSSIRYSFANRDDIRDELRALEPGRVPPLGRPLIPGLSFVVVDTQLMLEPEVGFNAAEFEASIIMPTDEFRRVLPDAAVFATIAELS